MGLIKILMTGCTAVCSKCHLFAKEIIFITYYKMSYKENDQRTENRNNSVFRITLLDFLLNLSNSNISHFNITISL